MGKDYKMFILMASFIIQDTVMAVQGELGNMMEKLSALNMTAGIEVINTEHTA